MTRQQWYHQLLAAAKAEYEMGYCTVGEYERGVLALVSEYEREKRTRKARAQQLRQQRREEATCTS